MPRIIITHETGIVAPPGMRLSDAVAVPQMGSSSDPINRVGLDTCSPRNFGLIRRASVGHSGTLKRFLIKKCNVNCVMYDPSGCRAIFQWHSCSSGETTKRRAHSRLVYLDTALSVGSIARVRTNIQATNTAQVNGTASDGTRTLRKSGTASTMLREKATAKSDHRGQFFIADNKRLPSRVVAASGEKTSLGLRLKTKCEAVARRDRSGA
jgi:hypothetical protein